MKRFSILIAGFAVLAVIVGGFGYYEYVVKPEQAAKARSAAGAPPPAMVSAEAAQSESWQRAIPAIGNVKASQGIEVASEVPGTVSDILFVSGIAVKAGDPLIELNLTTETAELESAQASLRESNRQLERQRALNQRGVASGQSLDDAIAKRDSDRAAVERIRALIAEKKIDAPFDGFVGIRQVDLGQYITAGQTIVTLQDLDPVYIDFSMPENRLQDIATGDTVVARVDAVPDSNFTGKIESIDRRVDQSTRNILVRASFSNADHKLLPGMFAEVKVIERQARQVVTVPRTAVTISLFGDGVFVATTDAPGSGQEGAAASAQDGGPVYTLEQRRVTVGEQRDEKLVIVDGLKAGEMVVIAGQNKLYGGQKVRFTKTPAIEPTVPRPRP